MEGAEGVAIDKWACLRMGARGVWVRWWRTLETHLIYIASFSQLDFVKSYNGYSVGPVTKH